ncbi:MAG: NAD-dependent deacetylase, partial [Fidelibacterota bacterium]
RYDNVELPDGGEGIRRCQCGGFIRPDVVWFGELLPESEYDEAERHCRQCDLFMSVGTSGAVYPAAGLPMIAGSSGAFLIEINPEETELSSIMDLVIRGEAGSILSDIVGAIQ